ncbi:MAG: DUF2793 domain-containing protein [Pseudomonadota bacterium]
MSSTPRLAFPFLTPGQAQKEYFHNEALQALDALVAPAIETLPQAAPPTAPAVGKCYVVGSAPTGEWAGKANQLACYSAGGWRFQAPVEGLSLFVKSTGLRGEYRAGAWEFGIVRTGSLMIGGNPVVSARGAAIASPSGGATVDSGARSAIDQILAALRTHGLIDS